jgi:hypothetical protein
MRKRTYLLWLIALGILACNIQSHAQAAYNLDRQTFTIATSGNSVTYNNIKGVLNFSIEEKFTGAPASVAVTVQGCMVGGTCQIIDSYTTNANAIRSITGLYTSLIVTASWTGGASPTAILNVYASANSAPTIFSYQYVNITTNTNTVVKTSPGFLHQVIISTKGSTNETLTLFDNTTCTGTKIATIDATAQAATFSYDVQFNVGLCITSATGTTPGDYTISYR